MKGNAVMKAKRVHGPSAHTIMHTRIAVRQLDGTYPQVNDQYGTAIRLGHHETGTAILERVKAALAAQR